MDWAKKIRELRFLEGLKQESLAQQLGVSQAAVSQWERGIAEPPPHIREAIRKRITISPIEQMTKALVASVVHSPLVVGLGEFAGGDVILRQLSEPAFAVHPLLQRDDIGQPLTGKLGPRVDENFDTLIDRGVFSGDVVCACVRNFAERNGARVVTEAHYIPFKIDQDRWFVRAEFRVVAENWQDNSELNALQIEIYNI